MRRVLFLAYYFPPIGGAGAQRPARMVRYLRDHGWEPVVVTGPGLGGSSWAPTDDDLMRDLPDDVEVLRVPGPEPVPTSWEGRAERWLGRAHSWQRWWVEGAVETGRSAGAVDLVYTWLSPFATTQSASRLARELGVPWVADLGDPWALDEMMVYPTGLHRRLELTRMRRALADAGAVVMSTSEAARRVRTMRGLRDTPVVAVPNGYDAADFGGDAPVRRDGAFRIVHTGYLHTELGLAQRSKGGRLSGATGGTVRGVDFLTRSHVYLLEAVERLRRRDPALASRLEVHLAGVLTDADLSYARRPGVHLHGYVSHGEALDLVRTADLLFLPMQDLPRGTRAGIVPGKTYEYLASGNPILAAVPDGDARDLLAEAGSAVLCRPADVDAMADAISEQLERGRAGELAPAPRPEVVARYEYQRLAPRLAAVFDGLLEREPAGLDLAR
jgi:glycosyltransferase involved in cell wall biosynthesis